MQMEEKIITMLEQISTSIQEQGERIGSLETRFDNLEKRFDNFEQRFDNLESRFTEQEQRIDEHKDILTALRSGQEYLKAEIDGMRIENAKEFGYVKKEISNMHVNFAVLREDVWTNKKDIYMLKQASSN